MQVPTEGVGVGGSSGDRGEGRKGGGVRGAEGVALDVGAGSQVLFEVAEALAEVKLGSHCVGGGGGGKGWG